VCVCAASYVRQYAGRYCCGVRQCVAACGSVWQCSGSVVAVCGSSRGSAWQFAWQRVAVLSTYIYTDSRSQSGMPCLYKGHPMRPSPILDSHINYNRSI
jgi:hypothetical protein